jgi:class 3 adenylate cyclase/tetratricopeptide (TPR) repeat protein
MSVAGVESVVDTHDGMIASVGSARPALTRADRRMVTAFFCDIVESSKLVIPQDPEDAYDQLSGIIDIMRRHVLAFGGTVCQTLGDGIYAVFGAPVSQENHAIRACYAADAILREVARGGRAVRIGICSGEVLWDHMAVGRQSANPATGPAIHIAAKMQQSAPPNGARLADCTARLISDWVETRPSMLLALGGDEPTQSHEFLGLRTRRRQYDDCLPLVGRESIRKQLGLAMAALDGDHSTPFSAHLVQGAAGLGKTRLIRALSDMARSRGLRVIEWQVPAVEPVGAPSPLHQLVVELLDCPLPRTGGGIAAMLRAAGASPEEADALVGVLLPSNDESRGGASAILALAVSAVVALARSAATRHPLVLLVEDAHWADTAVQATLSALLQQTPADTRMVLVLSSREEGLATSIASQTVLRKYPLSSLAASEVNSLLDMWMGPSPALETIKADLSRRARGNPFFMVECIRVLMMNGALLGDVGAMLPGPVPKIPLPDTVQSLLAARLDMLDEEARQLLRAASVVGPTFDIAVLAAHFRNAAIGDRLQDLIRLGFIDETRLLPRQECSFHHALLHEAVYTGITRRDRQHQHAALALLLGDKEFVQLPGRLAAQARHASSGCLWDTAVQAGRAAAQDALSRSLAVEAVSLLSIAVEANEKLEDTHEVMLDGIDLRLALARAAMPAGDGGRALLALDRAVVLARAAGDESRALAGMVQQINYERVYGRLDQAVALTETVIAYSGGMTRAHPELLIIAAACLLDDGSAEQALTLLDLAERTEAWINHERGLYLTLDAGMVIAGKRACCLSQLGRDAEAEIFVQKALQGAQASSYPFNRIYARLDLADVRMRQRRFGDVLAFSSEALNISRATGSTLLDAINLARRGLALAYLGRVGGGLADIERGLRLAQSRGAALHGAWARHARMLVLALAGRMDEALKERQELARTVQERGYGLLRRSMPDESDLKAMAHHLPTNSLGVAGRSALLH